MRQAKPPPAWLALDTGTAIRILLRIERDGAVKVWREEWARWSDHSAALRQWRLDHDIDDGIRAADYATWLYAPEQKLIIKDRSLLYPTDALTCGLLRAMGGLRLIEDKYPSTRSEANDVELDATSVEVELKPLTQSEANPGSGANRVGCRPGRRRTRPGTGRGGARPGAGRGRARPRAGRRGVRSY